METKSFNVVTSISMAISLTAAILSIIGIAVTGLYPGIFVLWLVALIPIASKFYSKKIISKSVDFTAVVGLGEQINRDQPQIHGYWSRSLRSLRPKAAGILTIINLLIILVVLWMTFVIVHDRVLKDC
jgi:hypothetical protein